MIRSFLEGLGSGFRRRQYVFIVTYARSGSTLLQKILASIPGAHVTGENADALAGLFASYRSAVQCRRDQGGTPRRDPGDPWRGADRIDPERYNRRLVRLFVEEILQPPAGARIVGFKEVRWFDHEADLEDYLDYIAASFPGCLLLFNRRRAEDVARSGWWREHPADIAAEVRAFDARTGAYAGRHPGRAMVLDYDAYCADPSLLAPVFARLGAGFDPARVREILAKRLDH